MKYLCFAAILLATVFTQSADATCIVGGTYMFSTAGWGFPSVANPVPNQKIVMTGAWIFSPASTPATTPATRQPAIGAVEGTVTRFFQINQEGTALPPSNLGDAGNSGTYTINASTCAGTVTFPMTKIGTETYSIVVSPSGSAVYWINTTQGIVLSAKMDRQ